jgi:cell wall-associated NlpC family hydrolase
MLDRRPPSPALVIAGILLATAIGTGCASAPRSAGPAARTGHESIDPALGARAAGVARRLVGSPYRYGGASPGGFDCSGFVVYSFARAGRPGLPHSVSGLEARSRPVASDALRPGDLLFFRLGGRKNAHVGIYLGDRHFVHAPSSGKSVEVVSFDDVYWGPRIRLAGRL